MAWGGDLENKWLNWASAFQPQDLFSENCVAGFAYRN